MSTYHHGDLPSALLQAAGQILEKEGVAALSLREVARRAGVSHNAPYRHFPDRDSLLAAVAAQGFSQLGQELGRHSGADGGVAYVRFALAHPQRFRLMFGGQVAYDRFPELRKQADAAYVGLERSFAQLGDDARFAAAATWSLVHGLAQLLLDGHFAQGRGEDTEAFVRRVLGAVRFAVGGQRSA